MPGSNARAFTMPIMNWSRLEEIREYDEKDGALVRKVVRSFIREAKSRITAIERAAGRRDAAALASCAHALKGAASNVGAAALGEMCAALETWGREGRVDLPGASTALMRQRFRETVTALEASLAAREPRRAKPSATRRTTGRKQAASRARKR